MRAEKYVMKIGIDARLIDETGVGRYIRNLINELGEIDKTNQYVAFLRKKSFDEFLPPNPRWKKALAEVPWHTAVEQLKMPGILNKFRLDVFHEPYHNPPIFYHGRLVQTIHDLIPLHIDTGKASTHPGTVYRLKRWGFRTVVRRGLEKAKRIIAVSEVTKDDIAYEFKLNPQKITVIYEGIDKELIAVREEPSEFRIINSKYILYVGNVYPHKNIQRLIDAYQMLLLVPQYSEYKLVFVGNDKYFYPQLQDYVESNDLSNRVKFFGSVNNSQLAHLYRHAEAFVFPSFLEGFGLPGIEAMALGAPLVCSNTAVFREIYGDAAVFFDPENAQDMARKIQDVLGDRSVRESLIQKGKTQAQKYSWRKTAEETLKVYEDSARVRSHK